MVDLFKKSQLSARYVCIKSMIGGSMKSAVKVEEIYKCIPSAKSIAF
jgi:hypothetical protein